jgi:hypothetical protein
MSDQNQTTVNVTIAAPRKSMAAAVILAIFFGPLGLLYASVTGGLVLLAADIAAVVLSFLTLGMGAVLFPLIWIASIIWAVLAVQGKDQQVLTQIKQGHLSDAVKTATSEDRSSN